MKSSLTPVYYCPCDTSPVFPYEFKIASGYKRPYFRRYNMDRYVSAGDVHDLQNYLLDQVRQNYEGQIAVAGAGGGIYVLRDPESGRIMRSGRTRDLLRREADHARDARFKNFDFETLYRTDIYEQQRGLEDLVHRTYNPPLDEIGAISSRNPNRFRYWEEAEKYLKECGNQ